MVPHYMTAAFMPFSGWSYQGPPATLTRMDYWHVFYSETSSAPFFRKTSNFCRLDGATGVVDTFLAVPYFFVPTTPKSITCVVESSCGWSKHSVAVAALISLLTPARANSVPAGWDEEDAAVCSLV